MKLILIIYNEVIEEELMEIIKEGGLVNYTKIKGILGKGKSSGEHLDTEIWPGKNNLIFLVAEDDKIKKLFVLIKELRKTMGHLGIKAFILPIEDMT